MAGKNKIMQAVVSFAGTIDPSLGKAMDNVAGHLDKVNWKAVAVGAAVGGIDITPVVNAVIALATTVVSVFLIPWIKSKTTAQQRSELVAWAKIGVAAAEQIYVGQGRGDEKKQYVLDFLKQKGFKVDEESVNNAIEAAVKQLNTEGLLID